MSHATTASSVRFSAGRFSLMNSEPKSNENGVTEFLP